MTAEPLHLKPDVQVEPLVDQWYAWSHLSPPATAARNITHRHFRIMDSYLGAPHVHASAAKNPKMLGGPFIDHDGKRLDEIRALRARTARLRAPLLELSAALGELDEMLRTVPDGHSLQSLYPQVPAPLRGYVELSYDLRHNASFRLIEPLLYRGHYDTSMQSLMLSTTTGDDRPFVLSTPRLETPGCVHLPWSFDDARVDLLFQLKTSPRPWNWIRDHLDIPEKDVENFAAFFTPEAPKPYRPYDGSGIRWRYFGHACILVETRRLNILFDPVLSYTYESDISRYTYADLPDRIDYVIITHNHQDHILFETLLQIRHKVRQIIVPRGGTGALQDPSLKLTLEHAGFRNVIELGELETLDLEQGAITGVPFLGEHADLAVTTKLAYLIQLGQERLLFAADSCNVEPRMYDHVHAAIGDVRTLFLGMECDGAPLTWLYGPLLPRPLERERDRSRRLSGSDYQQAIALVDRFACRNVYVYAMGQEPWLNYVMSIKYTEQSRPMVESNKLIAECRSRQMTAERLFGEKEILIDGLEEPVAGGVERGRP
jgi:L-ascorbate metabolism protein UlaG (beta-lactamase superfamily)